MIDVESFFKEKTQVPAWFKNHAIFKDIKTATKIFPTIGLPNFVMESDMDNSAHFAQIIRNLCYALDTNLNNGLYYLGHYGYDAPVKKRNRAAIKLLTQFRTQMGKSKQFIDQFNSDKKGLYLQNDIVDVNKKIFAKKGESLFRAYGKLVAELGKTSPFKLPNLDTLPAFKEYSTNNVSGKMQIVFSSDGNDGAWDILTMSMRGIQSCQSWTGGYGKCTIGSVLDPYTAIIYLTSGSKTEYGTKMVRRCIVRFVVDSTVKRPCLFLEFMYPDNHAPTMKAFVDAIRSKIGDKFPIVTNHNVSTKYYVPYSEMTKHLAAHSDQKYINMQGYHNQYGILPYRDCFMHYKLKEDIKKLTKDQILDEEYKYSKKMGDALKKHDTIANTYINVIKNAILEESIRKVAIEDCGTIPQYKRKICMHYFANKTTLRAALLKKLKAEMKRTNDKTIFVQAKPIKPVKAVKAAKIKKVIKKAKAPVVVQKPESLATTISTKLMPTISEVFKNSWSDMVATKKAKTPKAKNKLVALN